MPREGRGPTLELMELLALVVVTAGPVALGVAVFVPPL
jgi:hypothetical protein